MREWTTGEIVGLAPNFDNNLSLVARSDTLNMDPAKDGLIRHFLKFVRSSDEVVAACREMKFNEISEAQALALVRECDDEIASENAGASLCAGIERQKLAGFIAGRYDYLRRALRFGAAE